MPDNPAFRIFGRTAALTAATVFFSCGAFAQSTDSTLVAAAEPVATLPDSPGALASPAQPVFSSSLDTLPEAPEGGAQSNKGTKPPTGKVVGPYDKYIEPGEIAPKLTAHDKVVLGIKDAISPLSAAGWLISAGYEQATNGTPNYPQTGKGFAQRLGAAAARDASEGIFGDSILSPILHEDPRYYRMGPGHNFFKRATYSATRAIFVRTDGGRQTINFGNLGGNLGGSALTQLYYPSVNRSFDEVAKTFGGSVGGSALGFLASEFFPDILQAVHLQKRP